MNTKLFLRAGIFLLIFLGTLPLASAVFDNSNGNIIITPATPNDPIDEEFADTSGTDKIVSFWQLPLWVQLSVIGSASLSAFAVIKFSLFSLESFSRKTMKK